MLSSAQNVSVAAHKEREPADCNYTSRLSFTTTSTTMSEKLKEFVEIPQEFIQDGQQVCKALGAELRWYTNRSLTVLDPVYKTLTEGYARFAGGWSRELTH